MTIIETRPACQPGPIMLRSRYKSCFLRRLRALTCELPGARAGDVDSVHRLRVASRRLREALPAVGVGRTVQDDRLRRVQRQVRRLTRALGGVRELDVALGLLEGFASARPDLRADFEPLRQSIEVERTARRARMLGELERLDPAALSQRISQLVTETDTREHHALGRRRLADQLRARADRVRREIAAAGLVYAPYRLHPIRIAAKKMRYALELAREFHGVPTLALTRRVKRVQDLLGRLHDLEVLAGWLATMAALPAERRVPRTTLDPLFDADIVRLHAECLRHHLLLREVIDQCRARVQPALRRAAPGIPPKSTEGAEREKL